MDAFRIDKLDGRPLYEQLTDYIAALCDQGAFVPGNRLPPERELAAQLKISRSTVKKAVDILRFRGYLESLQGSGNYVASPQNRAGDPQTGQVRAICDRAFSELLSIRMPHGRLFRILRDYLECAEKRFGKVRLALIDCAPETLHCCRSQLDDLGNLDIETFILKDLETNMCAALRGRLSECDVIFTTDTHCEAVREMLPECADRLRSFAVAIAPATIVQLALLAPDSRIATVCRTPRFHEIISRMLKSISPSLSCERRLLERPQYPHIDAIPKDVNVLVLYTHSVMLTDDRYSGMLADFRARGGVVVDFSYEMDGGSRMFIQTVVSDLYRKKVAEAASSPI